MGGFKDGYVLNCVPPRSIGRFAHVKQQLVPTAPAEPFMSESVGEVPDVLCQNPRCPFGKILAF